MKFRQPALNMSPRVSDEVRKTTCYMCACRCGINVHLKQGRVAYIEGNRDHPVNRGVLCAKGSAGIMQVNAPSRLRTPLRRVGPRGAGEFEEISWDEALGLAADRLGRVRRSDPSQLAFFTGRDQSQSFTSFWAQNFGTPNYAAHGGFCSVNMAAAGIYTMGGSFWEFGQPDWERTRLLLLFGVAEDHDSNPIKMGIGRLKERGARIIGVNPVRSGYNAVADEWIGITPGTDGLFVLSIVHLLLKAGRVDVDYLARYTDAPVLLRNQLGTPGHGLPLRNDDGKQLVIDRASGAAVSFDRPGVMPDLGGELEQDGCRHRTVFHKLAERYLAPCFAPENVAGRCGIPAGRIRAVANEIARVAFEEPVILDQPWVDFRGEHHRQMVGRPVSFHAMRGISAHSNGFHTCRALHMLQILLGTVEVPGGFRFKPPYPKPVHAHPTPHCDVRTNAPLDGPHLGFVRGPEDLAIKPDGSARRIDKAFTWEHPFAVHGLMHMVIANAHAGDPYPIDTLFLYMANMAWNSSMNTEAVIAMLTDRDADGEYRIPNIIYADAFASEMVAYADLVLPDTTYLERHDCISLLDRPICDADAAADAIRWPVVTPDREVRGFQTVLVQLANMLKLPGFTDSSGKALYRDYADYMVRHERKPGIGPLSGWRLSGKDGQPHATGRGAPNPDQLEHYIAAGGFHVHHIPAAAQFFKPWNRAYQEWAVNLGIYDQPEHYLFELYVEPMRRFQLAAEGHGPVQPPEHLRERIRHVMDPLPLWYPPPGDRDGDAGEFPIHAITQRPMAMYHSWGSQNAWLRQIHGHNLLYLPTKIWEDGGFRPGDWARVHSPHAMITAPVARMAALNENTVWTWNAISKRKGTWALDRKAPEAARAFLLNHLIDELLPEQQDGQRWSNSDPVTGQAAWFDLRVRIERIAEPPAETQPQFPPIGSPVPPGPAELALKTGS